MVPDAQESPFALGRNVCGKPRENSTGHRTAGTPLDNTSEPVVRRGPVEAITGDRFNPGTLAGTAFSTRRTGVSSLQACL